VRAKEGDANARTKLLAFLFHHGAMAIGDVATAAVLDKRQVRNVEE
jgi:hypothetical protein